MATATAATIEGSAQAISAALATYAPEDLAQFESELRHALLRAADNLDLADVNAVLARWHALATMAANPLTEAERSQVQRAKAGDFTGLYTRSEQGDWIQL